MLQLPAISEYDDTDLIPVNITDLFIHVLILFAKIIEYKLQVDGLPLQPIEEAVCSQI